MNQNQVPSPQQAMVPVAQHGGALVLQQPHYNVHRSFFAFLGRTTRVFAPDGSLACYINAKLFSMRDETTLYADEAQTQPMMTMKARQIIGFNINHDIFDTSGARLGSVRNKGFGFFRDEWELLDANDQPVGEMREGDGAIWRRLLPILKNGKWDISIGGNVCAQLREKWTLFSKEYSLDLSMNNGRIEPRFAMACTILAVNRESARER